MAIALSADLSYDDESGVVTYWITNRTPDPLRVRSLHSLEDLRIVGPDGSAVLQRMFGFRGWPEVVVVEPGGVLRHRTDLEQTFTFPSAGTYTMSVDYRARTWTWLPSPPPEAMKFTVHDAVASSRRITFDVPQTFIDEMEEMRAEYRRRHEAFLKKMRPGNGDRRP